MRAIEVGSDNGKNMSMKKEWTQGDMDAALDALRNHNMSLTKASNMYGIPSTTLWQRAHRLGIDTPKKEGTTKWNEDVLNIALDALRTGSLSANKASKAYGLYEYGLRTDRIAETRCATQIICVQLFRYSK